MVITASKDNSAKLLDAEKLDVLKTFRTERPVNSAALSPIKDHVSIHEKNPISGGARQTKRSLDGAISSLIALISREYAQLVWWHTTSLYTCMDMYM